ncbi:hypothetical protein ACLMJK_006642 [Lecanora helva]
MLTFTYPTESRKIALASFAPAVTSSVHSYQQGSGSAQWDRVVVPKHKHLLAAPETTNELPDVLSPMQTLIKHPGSLGTTTKRDINVNTPQDIATKVDPDVEATNTPELHEESQSSELITMGDVFQASYFTNAIPAADDKGDILPTRAVTEDNLHIIPPNSNGVVLSAYKGSATDSIRSTIPTHDGSLRANSGSTKGPLAPLVVLPESSNPDDEVDVNYSSSASKVPIVISGTEAVIVGSSTNLVIPKLGKIEITLNMSSGSIISEPAVDLLSTASHGSVSSAVSSTGSVPRLTGSSALRTTTLPASMTLSRETSMAASTTKRNVASGRWNYNPNIHLLSAIVASLMAARDLFPF